MNCGIASRLLPTLGEATVTVMKEEKVERTMDSGMKQRRASPEALALMMANMKNNVENKAR